MARYTVPLYLAVHIICAWGISDTRANAAEFYSVVERDGTVALCLSKGSILFSDRCAGDGRLTIVEPIREGAVVWRSVAGTVSLENETPVGIRTQVDRLEVWHSLGAPQPPQSPTR
jgi:hypothetical protein